jgi:uncharacterized protein
MTSLTEDEIEDFLYFARANDISEFKNALIQSSQDRNIAAAEIIKAVIEDESGNTPLHYGSANGHLGKSPIVLLVAVVLISAIEIIKAVLEALDAKEGQVSLLAKSVINAQNSAGNTPLHWAALNGHVEVLLLLLSHGADPSILNAAGHDALFEAELNEKTKAAEVLLAEGKELENAVHANGTASKDEEGDGDGDGDVEIVEESGNSHVHSHAQGGVEE